MGVSDTMQGMRMTSSLFSRLRPALAASGLLAAFALTVAQAAPVATLVAQPAQGPGLQRLDGVLQPMKQATLAAQVGGNVLVLAVKPGDMVRAGQLVARVDGREAQAQLQSGQAGVSQAEALLRNARLQAERNQTLLRQGFLSQAAVDQSDTQLKAAQAGLQQAQASRQQAALASGFTAITAPFDGVVLATHVEAGDLASAGRAIATLYAPGAMRAVVQVPASLADSARQAAAVSVLLPDGRRITPASRQLLPMADAVSQTVEWRLALPPADAGARSMPGQAVQVQWQAAPAAAQSGASGSSPAPPAGAPVLPMAAVLQRGELTAVYVASQQRFVLRAVRTGALRSGGGIEVLAGLKPGERVAADAVAAGLAGATPAP